MSYSNLLYKVPGPYQRPGGTYATLHVTSEESEAEALTKGWYKSLPEAVDGKPKEDATPVSREELEKMGKELGIKFNHKTSTEALSARIDEALKEKGA